MEHSKQNQSGQPFKNVCVVIVTFNAEKWIEDCLRSLSISTYPVRIVIVDNNSTDRTTDLLSAFNIFKLIKNNGNMGFGLANNLGIYHSIQEGADFVFLLNQDTYIEPDAIERLVEVAVQEKDYGLFSPVHMNKDKTALDEYFALCLMDNHNHSRLDLLAQVWLRTPRAFYDIYFVNAAAWLLTRACIEQVGGFDPLFFIYGEDHDLFHRIRYHGFKSALVTSAVICHVRGKNPAPQRTFFQQINNRANYQSVVSLAMLKDISKPFAILLLRWLWQLAKQTTKNIIQIKTTELLVLLLAASKTFRRLEKVLSHRRLNCQPGAHWIAPLT